MAKPIRLGKAAGELNVGMSTLVEFLESNEISIDASPNTKLTPEQYDLLRTEFAADQNLKEKSKMATVTQEKRETISLRDKKEEPATEAVEPVKEAAPEPAPTPAPTPTPAPEAKEEEKEASGVKVQVVGKIDLDSINTKTRPDKKTQEQKEEAKAVESGSKEDKKDVEEKPVERAAETKTEEKAESKKEEEKAAAPKKEETETIRVERKKLAGPNVVGKMVLPVEKEKSSSAGERRKRKRVRKVDVSKQPGQSPGGQNQAGKGKPFKKGGRVDKPEITEKDIQKEIKETLARLSNKGGKSKGAKNRRAKRDTVAQKREAEEILAAYDDKVLKLTEFVTVSELATMMNVSSTEVISACMSLGIFASINQRLDAETIQIIAEDFGYEANSLVLRFRRQFQRLLTKKRI